MARRLAAACGGASTPGLRQAAAPSPLTAREREIAALVAAGLSNRAIAEKLATSVRTAEGHIYRACLKPGIADRQELAHTVTGQGYGEGTVARTHPCRAVLIRDEAGAEAVLLAVDLGSLELDDSDLTKA
nr:helix-turn-helix transcriptional regulator [Frankia sp. Cj3]